EPVLGDLEQVINQVRQVMAVLPVAVQVAQKVMIDVQWASRTLPNALQTLDRASKLLPVTLRVLERTLAATKRGEGAAMQRQGRARRGAPKSGPKPRAAGKKRRRTR